MFCLGVSDFDEQYLDDYRELNIKWAKFGKHHPGGDRIEQVSDIVSQAAHMAELGITPIFDLRTTAPELYQHMLPNQPDLSKLFTTPPERFWDWLLEIEPEEYTRLTDGNNPPVDRFYCDWILEVVKACLPYTNTFEIWGELQCPILTQHSLPPDRYGAWLRYLKKRWPQGALLANGGLGIGPWKEAELQQLDDAGAFDCIDILNIHPFSFQNDPLVQAKFFDWLCAACRYMLRRNGKDIPIMATEWGYPSGVKASASMLLTSGVYPINIPVVSEEEQDRLINASLRVFYHYDVGPICLLSRDLVSETQPTFWAYHCGIYRTDGSKKPSWNTVRMWGNAEKIGLR